MKTILSQWSLILLCCSLAGAFGGGLYEHIVIMPLFFIREMLKFQNIPLDSTPSPELSTRVAKWTFWTWFREPLDIISLLCSLLALYWLRR